MMFSLLKKSHNVYFFLFKGKRYHCDESLDRRLNWTVYCSSLGKKNVFPKIIRFYILPTLFCVYLKTYKIRSIFFHIKDFLSVYATDVLNELKNKISL